MPDFELSLPISPQHLLLLDWRNQAHGRVWVGRNEIREFNRRVALGADSLIISPHRSDEVEALAREFSRPEMQMEFDYIAMKDRWREAFRRNDWETL